VKELRIDQQPHPYNPYMKIPVGGMIKLATKDSSQTLKNGSRLLPSLLLRQGGRKLEMSSRLMRTRVEWRS